MNWLQSLAPLLGTALGGPLGGAAASFIADKLGIPDKTVEAVTEVLNSGKMSPEQISGIKLAEIDFQKFLEGNKIRLDELSVQDRDSARRREISVRDLTPMILGISLTVGFFGILSWMLQGSYKPSDALLVMLGALGQGFGQVLSYYFGSSSGSAQKTAVMERMAK